MSSRAEAPRRPLAPWSGVLSAVVTAAVVALAVVVIVVQPTSGVLDVKAAPASRWLSGEAKGQLVLASAGSARASASVSLGDASAFDVADLGGTVVVHDRRAGALLTVDGNDGSTEGTAPASVLDPNAAPVLVAAGDRAFVVDPEVGTVERLAEDGSVQRSFEVGPFTEWVGAQDGRLWLVDDASGRFTSVDESASTWTRFADPDADLSLSVVGSDPVILDHRTGRLQWLRRSVGIDVGLGSGEAVLQQPSSENGCVALLHDEVVECWSTDGAVVQRTLPVATSSGAELFTGRGSFVVAWPDRPDVVTSSWWAEEPVVVDERPEPSGRLLVSWAGPDELLVDDPGSRYAFSADGSEVVPLDKFSERTVAIDGTAVDDPDLTDSAVGVGGSGTPDSGVLDDDGVDEPPIAEPDVVTTRPGRETLVAVLVNDVDPDGDIVAVTRAGPASGTNVGVVRAESVAIRVDEGTPGPIEVPYAITDPTNRQDESTVTVTVVADGSNTAPETVDDEATTSAGQAVSIPVLANDTDPESDPLAVVAVGDARNGLTAIDDDGRVRYAPAADFDGIDEFTYTVADGYGGEASGRVRVDVAPPGAENRAPIPAPDRASTVAGGRVRVPVLANDVDPDGDELRVVSVSQIGGAIAVVSDGRSIDVVPEPSMSGGPLVFSYTVEDTRGGQASAQLLVLVENAAANRPPVAVDDRFANAQVPQTYEPLRNDTDPDNDQLTIQQVSQPTRGGSVVRVSGTEILFQPQTGFVGTSELEYVVQDPDGAPARARIFIDVAAPTGASPIAKDDFVTIVAGGVAEIDPLANDVHPDGLQFALDGPVTARGGTVVVRSDRTVTFTPSSAEPATHVLDYRVRDVKGRADSAQIFVTVEPRSQVNRPPTPADDRRSTDFETPVVIDVLENDSDPDGDRLEISAVSEPAAGTATREGSRIRYSPRRGFTGLDSFFYTVRDPDGEVGFGSVVVEVGSRPAMPPVAIDDLVSLVVGTSVVVDPRINDEDPDGDRTALRLRVVSADGVTATAATNGIRIVAPATPGTGTVVYSVTDVDGLTARAAISVVVQPPPNARPVAVDDVASTGYLQPVEVPVLANDTDDGATLQVVAVSRPPVTTGRASISSGAAAVSFTPAAGFTGTTTFTYTVADSDGLTASANVSVTVLACAVAVPVVVDDDLFTGFEVPLLFSVLANDPSPTGELAITQPVTGGTVTVVDASTGRLRFTPAVGFNGTASFTYSLTTSCQDRAVGRVTIDVNRPPAAVADAAATVRDVPVLVPVLRNDVDPDGQALTVVATSAASGGAAVPQADGTVLFTPAPGFTGPGSFVYTVADPGGLSDTAVVRVTVSPPPNQAPIARDDAGSTPEQTPIVVDVLANDSDPDGVVLTVVGAGPASIGGPVTHTASSVTYRPAPGVLGPVTIPYTISDADGATASATITVTVTAVNRAPVAQPDFGTSAGGASADVDVVANDSDPDGDPLAIAGTPYISSGVPGSVTSGTRSITYTPSAPVVEAGEVVIVYTVSDGRGGTDTSTLTISVTP